MNYWNKKKELMEKARKHTREMEELYSEKINDAIGNSRIYSPDTEFDSVNDDLRNTPDTAFANTDTVSAAFRCNPKVCGKTAILNFASYKNAGGMFIEGSSAQEEALCHESFLYNVLKGIEDKTGYYTENQKNLNKGLYTNRAIYTPDVLFIKDKINRSFDVITCASPNRSVVINYGKASEDENLKALVSRAAFLRNIAEDQKVETLILGAWGCGVFKQKPAIVFKAFREVFSKTTVKRIVYAVPGKDENAKVFADELRDAKYKLQ